MSSPSRLSRWFSDLRAGKVAGARYETYSASISEVHPVTIGEYCVWTHAKRCTSMARGVERSPYELDMLALVRLYSQDAPSSGHVQANPYAEVDSARSSWTVGACRANFHRAAAM